MIDPKDAARRAVSIAVARSMDDTTAVVLQTLGELKGIARGPDVGTLQRAMDEIGGLQHHRGRGHPEIDDAAAIARVREAMARGVSRGTAIAQQTDGDDTFARRLRRKVPEDFRT
jgi:hypothetical protein